MRTYFLISTANAELEGWTIFAEGRSVKELAQLEPEEFKDRTQCHRDIRAQTLRKNAVVVSKTTAKRVYNLD